MSLPTSLLALIRPNLIPIWVSLVSIAFSILALFITLSISIERGLFCRIRIERRHEATTFWSRNGERLIVGLVGVILGALGKELLTWMTKMLK